MRGRSVLLITGMAIAGTVVASTPAAAQPLDKGRFHDVFTDSFDCDGTPAQIDGDVWINFTFNLRGSSPFPYYRESAYGTNVFTNLNLSDMATCYKAFHRRVVPALDLESKRFGVDAEFTVKVARAGFRIFEVPISYFGRSQAEGKKIRMKDGFSALGALVRHSFSRARPAPLPERPGEAKSREAPAGENPA